MNHAAALTMLISCALLLGCHTTIADRAHPVPESDLWLTYKGGDGPGVGKHIVLIAAEQEYRAEQAMPMLARTLSQHHGFDCTVLFLMNEDGLVDPTQPSPFKEEGRDNIVPGLQHLAEADAVIWFSRFLQLNDEDIQHLYDYFDSGKPMVVLRTANHGLWRDNKPYVVNGERVSLREMLGGAFMGHYGGWKREATLGITVPENADHPVLIGVDRVWGTTNAYKCHKDDQVPADCTPLLMGQPMRSHDPAAEANTDKAPVPVAWTKTWTGNQGKASPILHFTMGSAQDFANEGVRRVTVNGVYWGLGMADQIKPDSDMSIIGEYKPMKDGFNYEKLGVKPRPASYFR
ncbi:MAG: ThuA domain-containing protein [Planctomycetota bacterium]